jgi:hypothetical protein
VFVKSEYGYRCHAALFYDRCILHFPIDHLQLNDKGDEVLYRIVGADEFEMDKRYISLDSPLAQALLKKTFDDQVQIHNELQKTQYTVFDIQYGLEFIVD